MEALPTIICVVIVLVVDWFIAQEFYNVAQMKGYNDRKYMWYAFLLGIVGYLLVIALPTKETAKTPVVDKQPKEAAEMSAVNVQPKKAADESESGLGIGMIITAILVSVAVVCAIIVAVSTFH